MNVSILSPFYRFPLFAFDFYVINNFQILLYFKFKLNIPITLFSCWKNIIEKSIVFILESFGMIRHRHSPILRYI